LRSDIEDVAYMTVMFEDGVLAHCRMSWLDPLKIRRITVIGSEKMVVYDDLETHEKLKIYDKRVSTIRRTDTFGESQFAYHYGSVVSPYISFEEPLRVECLHFLECVRDRKQPDTDGRNGLEVVRVIEAAQRSLRDGGRQLAVDGAGSDDAQHEVLAGLGSDGFGHEPARLVDLTKIGNGLNGNGGNGHTENGHTVDASPLGPDRVETIGT
jgi:hypothetical protein